MDILAPTISRRGACWRACPNFCHWLQSSIELAPPSTSSCGLQFSQLACGTCQFGHWSRHSPPAHDTVSQCAEPFSPSSSSPEISPSVSSCRHVAGLRTRSPAPGRQLLPSIKMACGCLSPSCAWEEQRASAVFPAQQLFVQLAQDEVVSCRLSIWEFSPSLSATFAKLLKTNGGGAQILCSVSSRFA